MTKLLKQKRIPQEDLARAIHVAPNRISKWKAGQGLPRPHHLLLIARYFGVSVESLIDDDVPMPLPAQSLSAQEQSILFASKSMGYDEAMRRLVSGGAPAGAEGVAVSWEEPPAKVRGRRKARKSG
jgi:transcriptional regulator with XRE-family HTH domain